MVIIYRTTPKDYVVCRMKVMSRDKSVDLTGVLSCRATFLERLRHTLPSLRHVSNMWRHKPDLLFFRSIAGTGGWSIKQACSRYVIKKVRKDSLRSASWERWLYKCLRQQSKMALLGPVMSGKLRLIFVLGRVKMCSIRFSENKNVI